MKRKNLAISLFLILFFNIQSSFGQLSIGKVLDKATKNPIEYVNIGIINQNKGTTSNLNGEYELNIDPNFDKDSIRFSCIGYLPQTYKVSDFKKLGSKNIVLQKSDIQLKVVNIRPKNTVQKNLGYSAKNKKFLAGGTEWTLGKEFGVILKIKKTAHLETLHVNVAVMSLDTAFFRVNFYKVDAKNQFSSILNQPIYMKIPKDKVKETLSLDLLPFQIYVEGDCLLTLECVKNFDKGKMLFCAGFGRFYFRNTSQAKWETVPFSIGINVDATVEK